MTIDNDYRDSKNDYRKPKQQFQKINVTWLYSCFIFLYLVRPKNRTHSHIFYPSFDPRIEPKPITPQNIYIRINQIRFLQLLMQFAQILQRDAMLRGVRIRMAVAVHPVAARLVREVGVVARNQPGTCTGRAHTWWGEGGSQLISILIL